VHSVFRHRQFAILWAAGLVSSLAGWCLGMAQAIHVYDLTRSPVTTAGVTVAATLPAAALGNVGGLVGDRVDRVRLLKIVSLVRVAVVASLLIVGDQAWAVLAVVFLQAAAMQFFTPAEQAMVADVVDDDELPSATGANSAAMNITRLAGPALGGGLMTAVGFGYTIAFIVAALAVASALVWFLRPNLRVCRQPGSLALLTSDWIAGARVLVTQPSTRGVAALHALDACKEGAFTALFPVLMLGVIGTSPAFMGVVNSSFAVTAILAGPTIAFTVRRLGYRIPIAAGAGISGALLLALALHPTPTFALSVFALCGYPFTVSWVAANTLLLIRTKSDFRARVVGGINSLYSILMLISAAASGIAADHLGVLVVIAAAAALQILAAPAFLLLTRRINAEPHNKPTRQ
jgi:predicted MFS family arabinose efflux permease